MASTSTNKQPLLVDNVLHNVVDLESRTVPPIEEWNVPGKSNDNSAVKILDGSGSDGAIIEDLYCISRGGKDFKVVLFLSSDSDYMRQSSIVIGTFSANGLDDQGAEKTTAPNIGEVIHYLDMPYVIAPVPNVGSSQKLKAIYVPRGRSLWAGIDKNSVTVTGIAPLLGVQGGWY